MMKHRQFSRTIRRCTSTFAASNLLELKLERQPSAQPAIYWLIFKHRDVIQAWCRVYFPAMSGLFLFAAGLHPIQSITIRISSTTSQALCSELHCYAASGDTWILDSNMDIKTLTASFGTRHALALF
eukprot:TRINITY_DN12266_c0_g2_i10.p5 TRINITY_DN12266_c0_g2~~TRINITY_DN12266_c0_g2_i10.p5  ORF type:complete len:127 (+),score=16.10 TRINITY_DN12266_c0_g2_i10:996-1376(+)